MHDRVLDTPFSGHDLFLDTPFLDAMITHLRELARLAHSSLRGWDREHVLQLLAAVLSRDTTPS